MKKEGFSLIELLVSLGILATLSCLCLSFAPSLYRKNQLQTVADEIQNAINIARTEALSTGEVFILTHLPNNTDWSAGMLLFAAPDGRHYYTPDAKLLHEWHWQFQGMKMKWHGFQSMDYLLFSPEISSSAVNGYFLLANNNKQIRLIVNRLGRVSTT